MMSLASLRRAFALLAGIVVLGLSGVAPAALSWSAPISVYGDGQGFADGG